jgi:hypothetical protein
VAATGRRGRPIPGAFAYVTARLRYGGSAARWGFAVYLASKNGYQDSVLPTGHTPGAPEDALDTACGLYLGDPTAWT